MLVALSQRPGLSLTSPDSGSLGPIQPDDRARGGSRRTSKAHQALPEFAQKRASRRSGIGLPSSPTPIRIQSGQVTSGPTSGRPQAQIGREATISAICHPQPSLLLADS